MKFKFIIGFVLLVSFAAKQSIKTEMSFNFVNHFQKLKRL